MKNYDYWKKSQITDISTFCYWLHQKGVGIYVVLTQDHMGKIQKYILLWSYCTKVLYKLCVFYVDRNSKMTTTAGHIFYIGPIGSFYNQVNDTGSWDLWFIVECEICIWGGNQNN